jgi:PAS domain S-box-containing protein
VPGCVVQLDADGQFVLANKRAEEVLGLETDEVTDRTYNDPEWHIRDLNGDPIPDEELPFRRVRDTGEPVYGVRHTIEWPDSTRKVLLVNGAPLFDENGDVDSVVFSLTDITEQRDRERELRRTRRRLELALETTDTGVFEWNMRTDEVVWNDSLERVMGLEPGEFEDTFEAFIDRVHPDDLPRVQEQIDHATETESMYQIEFRMKKVDGSYRWADVRGHVIRDEEGERMVGVHHDITERKEHEQELRQSSARVEALFDHSPDMINVHDMDGNIIDPNPQLCDSALHVSLGC